MSFLFDIIKGMLMGIANIIPGVSGGTMAVSLGIYDRMIGAISHLFDNVKKSIRILFPLLFGMAAGIVGFSYIIEYLLENHPFPTSLAFIGLILGGLPSLISAYTLSMRTRRGVRRRGRAAVITPLNALLFCFFAALVIIMALNSNTGEGVSTLTPDVKTLIILFFVGIVAAATMIIPGVSGSLVLMILGYYYGILSTIKSLVEGLRTLNVTVLIQNALVLIPFGLGVVIGIFLVSKLIEYLFHHHAGATYSAILGLIAASPAVILINTGALSQFSVKGAAIGGAAFIICALVTWKMGEGGEKSSDF